MVQATVVTMTARQPRSRKAINSRERVVSSICMVKPTVCPRRSPYHLQLQVLSDSIHRGRGATNQVVTLAHVESSSRDAAGKSQAISSASSLKIIFVSQYGKSSLRPRLKVIFLTKRECRSLSPVQDDFRGTP